MKNKILHAILFLAICVGCKKTKLNLESDLKKEFDEKLHPSIQNIAIIHNNDVYYLADLKGNAVRLTQSPQELKTNVKVSYDGTKVAYLDASNQPVIIGTDGKLIATLTNYIYSTKVEWSGDSQSLFILWNNKLNTFGPPQNIPPMTDNGINFNSIYGSGVKIYSFAISKDNDLLYSYQIATNSGYYYTTYDYKTTLKTNSNDKEALIIEGETPIDINFSHVTKDMLAKVASGSFRVYSFNSTSYQNLYNFSSSSTTLYRSDLGLAFGAYQGNGYQYSPTLLRASNSNSVLYTLGQFATTSNTLSIDWK